MSLPPESQTWEQVNSRQQGLPVIQPFPSLHETSQLALANRIVSIALDVSFLIRISNLCKYTQYLLNHQVIGSFTPHLMGVLPTRMTAVDVLGTTTSSEECASPSEDVKSKEGKETTSSTENLASNSEFQPTPLKQDNGHLSNDWIHLLKALEALDFSHMPESHSDYVICYRNSPLCKMAGLAR